MSASHGHDESSSVNAIDDVEFASSIDATPLQIEKAKVQTLKKQLVRTLDEKRQIQRVLKDRENDLEKQMQMTLRLQKSHAKKCREDAMAKQVVPAASEDVQELKNELASTQKDLADEIAASKKREARLQRLLKEQHERHLQQAQKGGDDDEKRDLERLIKSLEKQRSELLVVVKRQMKMIDVLKQQRAHVEAVALLNITEKEFTKEVTRR